MARSQSSLLVLTLFLGACQPQPRPATTEPAEELRDWTVTERAILDVFSKPKASPIRAVDGVTHVVLCWLNNAGDAAERQKLVDASHSFSTIPGVAAVLTGTPLPSSRPIVDASYDVAVVLVFDSEDALRAYDAHPTHRQAVTEILRPLTKRIQIYDFRNLPPTTRPAQKK